MRYYVRAAFFKGMKYQVRDRDDDDRIVKSYRSQSYAMREAAKMNAAKKLS